MRKDGIGWGIKTVKVHIRKTKKSCGFVTMCNLFQMTHEVISASKSAVVKQLIK